MAKKSILTLNLLEDRIDEISEDKELQLFGMKKIKSGLIKFEEGDYYLL